MENTSAISRSSSNQVYDSPEARLKQAFKVCVFVALFIANFIINVLAAVGMLHNVNFTSLCGINLGLALLSFSISIGSIHDKPPGKLKNVIIALSILRLVTAALFTGLAFGKIGPFTNNEIMGTTYLLSGVALVPISLIGVGMYSAYKFKKR